MTILKNITKLIIAPLFALGLIPHLNPFVDQTSNINSENSVSTSSSDKISASAFNWWYPFGRLSRKLSGFDYFDPDGDQNMKSFANFTFINESSLELTPKVGPRRAFKRYDDDTTSKENFLKFYKNQQSYLRWFNNLYYRRDKALDFGFMNTNDSGQLVTYIDIRAIGANQDGDPHYHGRATIYKDDFFNDFAIRLDDIDRIKNNNSLIGAYGGYDHRNKSYDHWTGSTSFHQSLLDFNSGGTWYGIKAYEDVNDYYFYNKSKLLTRSELNKQGFSRDNFQEGYTKIDVQFDVDAIGDLFNDYLVLYNWKGLNHNHFSII